MKIFSLLIALHISLLGTCQSNAQSNSIDFYFNPINVRIGNLNQQRIILDHDRININYKNYVTQEVGARFNHKLKKSNLSFLYGINYKQIKYGYVLTIDGASNFFSDADNFSFHRSRSVGLLGIKFGISLPIVKSTSVSLSMETNLIPAYDYSSDGLITDLEHISTSTQVKNESKLQIRERIGNSLGNGASYFIPELNFQTQLRKNLSLNYGVKLKFWGNQNHLDIQVKGYYDIPADPETVLFESKVNTSQILTYFGLAYTFELKKKNKPE